MNTQCIRCLSSMFEKKGAAGCAFCAGKVVKQFTMSLTTKNYGDTLPVNRVEIEDKKNG